MARPQQICESVYLVGGSDISNVYDCLVYAVDLGELVLIDCGGGPGWPLIKNNMHFLGLDPTAIKTLVLTHGHFDHIGAAKTVVEETNCRVVAHSLDAPYIESGDPEFTAAAWYGKTLPKVGVDYVMQGKNDTLDFPRGTLRLIHTPGHTPGSIAVYLETDGKKVLFGQDIHGPFSPDFQSHLGAWRKSMEHLLTLEADILCEGHFGVFMPAESVRDYIQDYLDQYR